MGARQALYACLMLASTVLAATHAAAQLLPARDLDVLGPGSFSHSLANTQREQAAAQLQASGVKVTPLSAAAGTVTAGAAPAAAAKPTSGTTSPTAAAKAGANYGATDKFAYGDDDYFYIDIYRRSDPNAPKFTLGEYFDKLLNEMQDEVDEQDHDFKGPKYVYPKPGSGYHGSSEHHGGDSYHHRRHGSHSYDAPHHHHSYSSRQGGHGQQHYTGDSSYYHGHEEYRQQYRDSYGQYSEEQYNEERYGDDDEEQYYSGSGYDEPKRTTYSYHGSYEDVCVRETARSQCDETAAHGYIYTSSLACCHKHHQQYYEDQHYEDQHYDHDRQYSDGADGSHHRKHSVIVASTPSLPAAAAGSNPGVAAKVSGGYSHGPRMFYPRGGNSECVWNIDYLDGVVQVNQHTQQIGVATATCHFNASTAHCGSPLCEGMTVTISADVYQTTNVVTKFGPKYPSATAPSIGGTCGANFDLGFDFNARRTAGSSKQASAKLELPATQPAPRQKPAAAAAPAPAPVPAAKPPVETKTVYVNVPVPTPVPTPVYVYVPSPPKAPEVKAGSKQPAATAPQPTGPTTQPQPQPQSGSATAAPATAQPSAPAKAPSKHAAGTTPTATAPAAGTTPPATKPAAGTTPPTTTPAAGTTAPSKPDPARPAKYAEYRGSKQAATQGKRAPLRPLAKTGGESRAVPAAAARIQRYGDQEYFSERSSNFVESVTPTGLYGGRATILAGVVTSVTGLEKGVEYHRGMIEHVVFFEGTELSAVAYEALPYDTPHVKPGAYKIVFMGEEDQHDKQY